jgi:hypothetical protein
MDGACTRFEHFGINPDSIVANAKAKLLSGVPNFDFDQFCPSMAKCISQDFATDPIEFVLKDRR